MKSGIFCFYMGKTEIPDFPRRVPFGAFLLQMDERTPYELGCWEDRECLIFGIAVDVRSGQSQGLAQDMAQSCQTPEELVAFEKNLGGKYVLFYRKGEDIHILGDATCSVPISYSTTEPVCSSNGQYIVSQLGLKPDKTLQKIRNSSDIFQAMPYDRTVYRELKQLLPNHILHLNKGTATRFRNADAPQKVISPEEAAERTAPMIEKIAACYRHLFRLYCPITAGRDSRVVLAFLEEEDGQVPCYTMRHPEHRGDEQDLVIPKLLCEENHFPYEQLTDVTVSQTLKEEMDRILGKDRYAMRTLRIAQTIREHCGDGAIVNGDSIGQVGKCSLHRDIPLWLATPGYFRCKLHNYSREAKQELAAWMKEIQESGEQVNVFDLFSIENRLGRWAGQENLIYNTIGQAYLNIFNSRSILYLWTAVDRKERKLSRIHIGLLRRKMPSLLEVPFEEDKSAAVRLAKANGLTYWASSYGKYMAEKIRFRRENA